ncbi:LamG domain-containing protein [Spirosoma sp. KNUC1025]|uniref:LamG domain-containing protein n=1 Tax=Spirosoma sp. KNUC1025 TaxID=2894082 RepID=UPI00386899D0|nr:LamG domain-containing protein [Spirosoma sp. KNUC1025]
MKNNSFSVRSLLSVLFAFVLLMVVFESCKKEDNPVAVTVDKSRLKARLDSANAGYALAVEGAQVGQFEAGSKAVFKTAIDAANTVYNNTNATQSDVNNAYVNLGQAGLLFLSKQVQQIAPANLVLYLKMDGDTKDASGKGFDGTLKAGSSLWGAGTPTLTKDRYGVDNKAYHFFKGGNIEVPYNSVLNPSKEMTVSVWARMDSSNANNYILGLNRWNGYKLNIQQANYAFFTVKTTTGIIDHDNANPPLDLNKWYLITVTYKEGLMNFYLNGTLTKSWDKLTGTPVSVKNTINLAIGQDLPTSLYGTSDKDDADGNNFYGPWGGYFRGDLDELRIYNVALSDTQIKSIYTAEKP